MEDDNGLKAIGDFIERKWLEGRSIELSSRRDVDGVFLASEIGIENNCLFGSGKTDNSGGKDTTGFRLAGVIDNYALAGLGGEIRSGADSDDAVGYGQIGEFG